MNGTVLVARPPEREGGHGTTSGEALGPARRWLAGGLVALGVGLAANSVLGPLVLDAVRYPFSESVRNQTLGLEAVSLVLVAPLCLVAGVLVARGRRAGAVLALGPAAYAAYMLVQYVVGPQYLAVPRVLPLHLGLFVLSAVVAVGAWAVVGPTGVPVPEPRVARRRAGVLVLLAVFVVSRYVPTLAGSWSEEPLPPEFRDDPSMFWTILLLDLGVVVPAVVATAVALRRGAREAGRATAAVLGWFALVPPSVAAMSVAMLANGDPNATAGQTAVLVVAAVVFAAYAVAVHRPLLRRLPE